MNIIKKFGHISVKRHYCSKCGHIERIDSLWTRNRDTGKMEYIGPFVKNKKGVLEKLTYFQIIKFLIKNR